MQERFLLDSRSTSAGQYFWWVPLTYTWGSDIDRGEIRSAWIPEGSSRVAIPLAEAKEDKWIIFNVDQVGKLVDTFHELPFI